uniref:Putative secreted protein n=1 Tax=Anopheles marajoara TaxID=58244 RepID=A0A2M4CFM3_9DIPT
MLCFVLLMICFPVRCIVVRTTKSCSSVKVAIASVTLNIFGFHELKWWSTLVALSDFSQKTTASAIT